MYSAVTLSAELFQSAEEPVQDGLGDCDISRLLPPQWSDVLESSKLLWHNPSYKQVIKNARLAVVSRLNKLLYTSCHSTKMTTVKLKGVPEKKRPPEILNCSKFKTCRARKLKLHQPVYLIR